MRDSRKQRTRAPQPAPVTLRADRLEDRLAPAATFPDRTVEPNVVFLDPAGAPAFRIPAYPADFTGGVWVATADITGDGTNDYVSAPGPGHAPEVRVFDGRTGLPVVSLFAYEGGFSGGVYVVAADLTGDGKADIITGTDRGGGPRVRVFDGAAAATGRELVLADFLAIDDPSFRGGVRVAVGDVNADGTQDLIASAGNGGGPRVAGFDGRALGRGRVEKLFPDFFAFEPGVRNGVYLTAGDVTGDGAADLVLGGGPGGGPRVRVVDGAALLAAGPVGSLDSRPA
ncbi:MAG: FG-GAP repeat domain-containing protein, partial [Fimbriiglobus sp.]